MKQVDIEHLLPKVDKPSRYIDHEINACRKEFTTNKLRFAFAFPDAYEIGISHLGLKILYSIINALPDTMADRVYLPWVDLADLMRAENLPLFGWESRMPVQAFDVLGITLQSELTYSNVLELIDLSGLNIRSEMRQETDPIVMAGGPCATNPLPLAPFIDVFFMGEAEEGIIEMAEILKLHSSKQQRLLHLAALDSCYVPAMHHEAKTIQVRKYNAFHKSQLQHKPQLLSWQLATHNRYVAEIMRGCSRGCRFCHAGYFYRPVRERAPESILLDLLTEVKASGWDEAGLVSLSSSDYSCIQELLLSLLKSVDTHKTHISLPSLRVDSLSSPLVQAMQSLGREGLTIAPEAGSERLRKVINKNLTEAEIMAGIETAIQLGWQKIKLYFMLGLPTETDADIEAIIALIDRINAVGKRRFQINVTLSPFVPKPFTPFQWCGMLDGAELLNRAWRIKNCFIKKRNIKLKYHTIETSVLEAALTRGDLQMADVVEAAWKKGARFDGWNEQFNYAFWQEAYLQTGVDAQRYLEAREIDKPLPWDFIDTGVCKQFLLSEWQKALSETQTPDCRELCTLCGVCNQETITQTANLTSEQRHLEQTLSGKPVSNAFEGNRNSPSQPPALQQTHTPQPQHRYRVHYQKLGLLRFISHLDWMRMLFRRISVLELQTVFTQGFNPHPKVSLSPPLPVGVEGLSEFFDISFYAPYPPQLILQEFSLTRIPDFNLLSCEALSGKKALPLLEHVVVQLNKQNAKQWEKPLHDFMECSNFPYTKSTATRQKSYDLKQIIQSMELKGTELHIVKLLESPAIFDILAAILALGKEQLYSLSIQRIGYI